MKRTENHIIDDYGRTLILRGVNLGGSSKIPATGNAGDITAEPMSFEGRPFPLEEAEEHFERLKSWGLTFIRFVITWEALEHAGPGIYDESYLAYLRKILLAAEKAGISVFMDPHQDVWSRCTGGDGALPGPLKSWELMLANWTLSGRRSPSSATVKIITENPTPA